MCSSDLQQTVECKHQRRDQGDHCPRIENVHAGLQNDQHANASDPDGRPAPPADLLAQHRPAERGDQKRIADEHRLALDQAENGKAVDGDADLAGKQQAAQDLQARLPRPGGGRQTTGCTRRQGNHESCKEPVSQHDHHVGVVRAGQMARDAVLQRKHDRGRDHQGNTQENYRKMLADEIVTHMDSKYRTRVGAEHRLVLGASTSAATSFRLVLERPEVFGKLAAQSTYAGDELIDEIMAGAPNVKDKNLRVYMDWGLYETLSPMRGFNLVDNSRMLAKQLDAAGIQTISNETPTGSGTPAWQARFARLVSEFFPIAEH